MHGLVLHLSGFPRPSPLLFVRDELYIRCFLKPVRFQAQPQTLFSCLAGAYLRLQVLMRSREATPFPSGGYMPKSSRLSTGARRRMKEIALRMQSRMRKLGYSQERLSDNCSIKAGEIFSESDQPTLRRDRIAKILMNLQHRQGSSAATTISDAELLILSRSLRCSVEWLSGRGLDEDPVVWNVLTEPERGTHLLQLIEEYEDRAAESTVWSEYLLCSFTTEEFMIAFHRAHFGEMDTAGVTRDKRELVEFFNKTGRARRKRVLKPGRRFVFTGLIYESELERAAKGAGVYRYIPRVVRRSSFDHLVRVLKDPALRMNLVIVSDQKARSAKTAWRDHETVGVMGDLFSLWNYHS